MDWRLRGIPPALWRRVRDKAGDRLRDVLLGLLRAYADGMINPLGDQPSPAATLGARGGRASGAALTATERRAKAAHAAKARWATTP